MTPDQAERIATALEAIVAVHEDVLEFWERNEARDIVRLAIQRGEIIARDAIRDAKDAALVAQARDVVRFWDERRVDGETS